jgi:hypothetical protein
MMPSLSNFVWSANQLGDPLVFTDSLIAMPLLRFIDFSLCSLSGDWVRTLCLLLDKDWQIGNLKVSDFTADLVRKIERNRNRFEAEKNGLSGRMIRYGKPVNEDLFE